MKKITNHIILACFACTFVSCIAPAPPLDVPQGESQLVVDGTFTNDEFFQVVLSIVRPGQETVYVDNAEVRILSEEDEILETLTPYPIDSESDFPYYASVDLKAEVGKLYRINVKAPNFPDSTTAESIIPFPSEVNVNEHPENDSADITVLQKSILLEVGINDASLLDRNYFHLNFYHIAKVDTNRDGTLDPIAQNRMKMNKMSPYDPGTFFKDNRGILLTDKSFPGSYRNFVYRVEFDQYIIDNLVDTDDFGSIYVELRTVSESYYDFMIGAIDQQNSGLNPFLDPSQDFTNVLNGAGIFGGFSSKTDTIVIER